MDFGRVPGKNLDAINFSLPKEPDWNSSILKGKSDTSPQVYLGCPQWGIKEWVGKIYPTGAKDAQFLELYAKQYNAVELNATHHRLYDTDAIKRWSAKAGSSDFKFCPKIYKGISHDNLLTDKQLVTDEFLRGIAAFEHHLGPVFIQLSDSFNPQRKEELFQFLASLPTHISFFVELRHPAWFTAPHLYDLLTALNQLNIGLIITDTAGRRDCCHMHLTQTKAFIRFVANHHSSDFARINDWVDRISYWLNNGLTEVYFFIHVYKEVFSPELTIYAVDRLNGACNLKLKKPVIIQPSLFD
ncbi:MAG: hypothetical protein JWR72_3747 [Flavisolibacter sp.]|nr:hypothetical protein [Flavisolibacter sp.]